MITRYLILLGWCAVLYAPMQAQIPFPEFRDYSYDEMDSIALSIDMDDVVVTAQYAPTDSKNALHQIRTINRATIEQQGATNLEQLLLQDLNVRLHQDPITGSQMRLLGVGGENVRIMIDGVPVIGRLDGNIDLGQINLNHIERVEIIEGPMSVNFGTDAIGGIINLISRKSQLEPFQLQVSQQLESRGENRTLLDMGIKLKDNWLLRLNGGYDQFAGYTDSLAARNLPWNPKTQLYSNAHLRYTF
ncbi:MAG: TonB-dependent receptor plug domain-containing protein, partial [Bacteroidota bacterium]